MRYLTDLVYDDCQKFDHLLECGWYLCLMIASTLTESKFSHLLYFSRCWSCFFLMSLCYYCREALLRHHHPEPGHSCLAGGSASLLNPPFLLLLALQNPYQPHLVHCGRTIQHSVDLASCPTNLTCLLVDQQRLYLQKWKLMPYWYRSRCYQQCLNEAPLQMTKKQRRRKKNENHAMCFAGATSIPQSMDLLPLSEEKAAHSCLNPSV
mmetsp:Transcript_29208/g.49156  ORF Transcript_29208/g.49156 Transcript_29208/m.49156 type:complete len:208 (+) Transcript_29208:1204-1827(+)